MSSGHTQIAGGGGSFSACDEARQQWVPQVGYRHYARKDLSFQTITGSCSGTYSDRVSLSVIDYHYRFMASTDNDNVGGPTGPITVS
jgi:hypothetical protein